jgi:hypothetical protein
MTRKESRLAGEGRHGPLLQHIVVAVCVASMVASCVILANWWAQTHHCTVGGDGVRVCAHGPYFLAPF